jgi:hypothetical protein
MLTAALNRQEMVMTDTRPQLVSETSIPRAAALIAGSLLIFAGIVFQLGQLGYGGICANSFWAVQMIATNVWNLLAIHLGAPSFGQMLDLWPLALVATGLTILFALKPQGRARMHRGAKQGV